MLVIVGIIVIVVTMMVTPALPEARVSATLSQQLRDSYSELGDDEVRSSLVMRYFSHDWFFIVGSFLNYLYYAFCQRKNGQVWCAGLTNYGANRYNGFLFLSPTPIIITFHRLLNRITNKHGIVKRRACVLFGKLPHKALLHDVPHLSGYLILLDHYLCFEFG